MNLIKQTKLDVDPDEIKLITSKTVGANRLKQSEGET